TQDDQAAWRRFLVTHPPKQEFASDTARHRAFLSYWDSMVWPAPESSDNMNTKQMGRLGLTDAEEDAIVAFLQTLTDSFMPR
ncbi:MAG: hypothetical protein ACLPKT_18730, partial [Methylocella sp.]